MPIGIDLLLLIIALLLAVASLAGKVPTAASVLVLCVEALLRLAGR
jgi:hypothetical protein